MIKKNRATDCRNIKILEEMTSPNIVTAIIRVAGIRPIARALGISHTTTQRWAVNGRLPYSDYTGETNYADVIVRIAAQYGIKVTRENLLLKVERYSKN
jgi:hypothetical protein